MARIVLFDGTDLSHFTQTDGSPAQWKVENGAMTVTHGSIVSKETYGDAHIHVEWMEPDMPEATGQWKGNSGVYIHGCYEADQAWFKPGTGEKFARIYVNMLKKLYETK